MLNADTQAHRFQQRLVVRVPAGLPAAVEIAARLRLTTPAEFARRALLDACQIAGVSLGADGRIATQTPNTHPESAPRSEAA